MDTKPVQMFDAHNIHLYITAFTGNILICYEIYILANVWLSFHVYHSTTGFKIAKFCNRK